MLIVDLDNGQRFITSMRYEVLPEIAADPTKVKAKDLKQKIHTWEKKHKSDKEALPYQSKCDQTMIGFAQNLENRSSIDKHTVTCFYGRKIPGTVGKESQSIAQAGSEGPLKRSAGNSFARHVPSEVTDAYIQKVNDMNLSWKANTCMLSKSHPGY